MKNKAAIFRKFVAGLILCLDLFLLPFAFQFLEYLKPHGFIGSITKTEQFIVSKPYYGPAIIFGNKRARTGWLWLQPLVGLGILFIFWRSKPLSLTPGVRGPEAAGQGQYGTAQWRTKKELDKDLTVWTFQKK